MKDYQEIYKIWDDASHARSLITEDLSDCSAKINQNIFLHFIQLASAIDWYLDSFDKTRPVNRKECHLLHCLVRAGGSMKPTEISKVILLSKHSVTRMVNSLERQGFVKREAYGYDLRTTDVVITKRGISFLNSSTDYIAENVLPCIMENLGNIDLGDLTRLLIELKSFLIANVPNASLIKCRSKKRQDCRKYIIN